VSLRATKGHGTENDFVVVPDFDGLMPLSASLVAALCDRHAGIGADGVLRVVRTVTATEPDVLAQADDAEFFMDYRNSDGSIAEMCGNGVRVFARYLQRCGLVGDQFLVATRGGTKRVEIQGELITVDMGVPTFRSEKPAVTASGDAEGRIGVAVDMPNPHVVVELGSESELNELDLVHAPLADPGLPEGQNVEFIVRTGSRRLQLRVHERGIGETKSCGTGICAAVAVAAGDWVPGDEWTVDVPGGSCQVSLTEAGSVTLAGPAELVADLEIDETWLSTHR
jgi:diaminopimelate epimerase